MPETIALTFDELEAISLRNRVAAGPWEPTEAGIAITELLCHIDAQAERITALEAAIRVAIERGAPLYTDGGGWSYCAWCGSFAGDAHQSACPWAELRAALDG